MNDTQYYLTRFVFQRSLAFIYVIAFLIVVNEFKPLCGVNGLLPARLFVNRIRFFDSPSVFWFHNSDLFVSVMAWIGLILAFCALFGITDFFAGWVSIGVWILLWAIYLSFVNVGQTFYGFGWEMLLLETGFLAIFLGSAKMAPNAIVIWLLRWVLFRLMFGAGLIKIRGDSCWRDLTCLQYHYETQPLPNPLSWYFHHLPAWALRAGVVVNHFVELIVPFGFFGPYRIRMAAAFITIAFQTSLILSGNLSWLNVITIVLCLACFDDRFWTGLIGDKIPAPSVAGYSDTVVYVLLVVIGLLSIQPTINLFSNRQLMNSSFDPFRLVNTYGAFGSVTRERDELIIEGTSDEILNPETKWLEYGFRGKPGDVNRMPPQVTPYHYKLDWQMWFAAMSPYYYHPWLVNLLAKLLEGQKDVLGLLRDNPFPSHPPAYVRVRHYIYHFTEPGEKAWWKRELVGEYLPPLSLRDPNFRALLEEQHWLNEN